MNQFAERILKQRVIDCDNLVSYGFRAEGERFLYRVPICAGEMELTVTVNRSGEVDTEVREVDTGDLYTLYLVEEAEGSFVGSVREACEAVLTDVAEKCFDRALYGAVARDLIDYVRKTYGDELEYLWGDDNAVWRRKDNGKWYGALLNVCKRKLGLDSDERTAIVDLRIVPEELDAIVDGKKYFRGYHMNKKHWLTLCLDGTVQQEEVCRRIDESYRLAKNK